MYKKEDDLLNKKQSDIISNIEKIRDGSECLFKNIKYKCDGSIEKNHLIQEKNYLSSISYNNKVMSCNVEDENYYRFGRKLREVSIKRAQRYKVLCGIHDKKLFSAIENTEKFDINNKEQCFQFALRAFIFTYSQNIVRQNFKLNNKYIEAIAEISQKRYDELMERFKQCYLNDEWSEIETYSIVLDKKIKFISCSSFYPFIDLKKIYKGYVKEEAFFNVFPQNDKTYILISYFKGSNYCRNLCKQLEEYVKKNRYKSIEKYFNKILVCQDINLVLGPQLWNSWSKKEQQDFYRYAHKLKRPSYKNFMFLVFMLAFKNSKFDLFKDFN